MPDFIQNKKPYGFAYWLEQASIYVSSSMIPMTLVKGLDKSEQLLRKLAQYGLVAQVLSVVLQTFLLMFSKRYWKAHHLADYLLSLSKLTLIFLSLYFFTSFFYPLIIAALALDVARAFVLMVRAAWLSNKYDSNDANANLLLRELYRRKFAVYFCQFIAAAFLTATAVLYFTMPAMIATHMLIPVVGIAMSLVFFGLQLIFELKPLSKVTDADVFKSAMKSGEYDALESGYSLNGDGFDAKKKSLIELINAVKTETTETTETTARNIPPSTEHMQKRLNRLKSEVQKMEAQQPKEGSDPEVKNSIADFHKEARRQTDFYGSFFQSTSVEARLFELAEALDLESNHLNYRN